MLTPNVAVWVLYYIILSQILSHLQSGPSSESDPGQLLIRNVTIYDSGWYTCIVSNQDDQSVNRSAWLSVSPVHPLAPRAVFSIFANHNLIGIVVGAALLSCCIIVGAVAVFLRTRQNRHQIIPWSKNALYGPMPSFEPVDSEWEFNREKYVLCRYCSHLHVFLFC